MPLDAGSRFQTVKDIGVGLAFLFAVVVLPLLYIYGLLWFSEKALPWLFFACAIVLAICLLVMLPLSIFRKLRPWTGLGFYLASYVFGTMLFAFSCLVAFHIWGYGGLIVGLILAGGGVVPIAFLAALFHGAWALLGYVVLGTVVTFGTRIVGIRLAESTPESAVANEQDQLVLDEEHVGLCEKCGAEIAARTSPLAMWDVTRLPDGTPVALLDKPHPCFDAAECLRAGMESIVREISAPPPELQNLIEGRSKMAETTCSCTSAACGHPDSKPCGKPVENPLPTHHLLKADGPTLGPEFLTGICEECLRTNGAYSAKP